MLWAALASLAVAITVNCVAVHAQKRHRFYDRFGRWDWTAHIVLLVVAWGAAIGLMTAMGIAGPEVSWPMPTWVRPLGLVVGIAASVIFGLAIRELGAQALFNGNFFGRGRPFNRASIYRLMADPMYVAYTLTFVGLAFRFADAVWFLFAAISAVGLNVVESRVERYSDSEAMGTTAPTVRSSTPDTIG